MFFSYEVKGFLENMKLKSKVWVNVQSNYDHDNKKCVCISKSLVQVYCCVSSEDFCPQELRVTKMLIILNQPRIII